MVCLFWPTHHSSTSVRTARVHVNSGGNMLRSNSLLCMSDRALSLTSVVNIVSGCLDNQSNHALTSRGFDHASDPCLDLIADWTQQVQ